jgi:polysaccharide pyruvyl transferase WcaK-like protein
MRIAHVFCHAATNLGDIYLKRATQAAFRTVYPAASFTEVETRKIFDAKDIAELNGHDLVLIGGGGLLLRDTFPNDLSDWQFGCGVDLMRTIRAPIVVYAIGYNRFRGQPDFRRPLFDRHIGTLIDQAAFFSVRNQGSVRALRGYVSAETGARIEMNPCPSILFPTSVVERKLGTRRVGLLLAGDRKQLRHPDRDGFLAQIRALAQAIGRHSELQLVAHQPDDLWYLDALKGVPYQVTELIGASPEQAIPFYSSLDLMIGDRGHAQMIPFGLGCRIVSLVSHDKLAWFLEDTGLEDHGVEQGDPDLAEKVLSLVYTDGADDYAARRLEALRRVSTTTHDNLLTIRERVSEAAASRSAPGMRKAS